MTSDKHLLKRATAALALAAVVPASLAQTDSLPSWNEGAAKAGITKFVRDVVDAQSPAFVPPADRIAVFDNDGTLWSEQPMYVQLAFAIDRVSALAPQHPEWKTQEPFASILRKDLASATAGGEKAVQAIVAATHAGMTTEEFIKTVTDWLATARHPKTGLLYSEMVYAPMLELMVYLRGNGFKTFIVSGGGIEFMRPWAERVYGIPPEQVIGSSGKIIYEVRQGKPVLARLAEVDFIDDKAGKPVAINKHIGRRPIAAFGNSDGDFEMLEWTTSAPGARFGLLIHHDDADREFAYDRQSHVGRLDRGLNEAGARGWTVVSMKRDWREMFPKSRR